MLIADGNIKMAACSGNVFRCFSSKKCGVNSRYLTKVFGHLRLVTIRSAFLSSSSNDGTTTTEKPPETTQPEWASRDPGPLFINQKVQEILKRLTGMNLDKIFEFTPSVKRAKPHYEFMTEDGLRKAIENSKPRAEEKLQMPPVLKEREEIHGTITYDPELQGLDKHKYVFTDISYGIPERINERMQERLIVVREPDGTLRRASWEEHDRMIHTFYPVPNRKYGTPRVFLDEYLTKALDDKKYKFVLDRACIQYEPDHPMFIKICRTTFEHIDSHKNYDVLHSTRHYGPVVFHLAFHKQIDNILQHLVQEDRIEEGVDVVRLYHILHPECKSIKLVTDDMDPFTVLKVFTETDALNRSRLELVLQTYGELQTQNMEDARVQT